MDIRLIPCSVSFTGLDLQLVPGSHAENKCREESFPTLYWIWCCMMNKGDSPFFIFTYVTVQCIIFSIFITNCLWKTHFTLKKSVLSVTVSFCAYFSWMKSHLPLEEEGHFDRSVCSETSYLRQVNAETWNSQSCCFPDCQSFETWLWVLQG